jgi:tryptophan-rich sensory protein
MVPHLIGYLNLNKAPWTPAGWVFGAAWTSVMLFFFSLYDFLVSKFKNTKSNFIVFIALII